MSVTWTDNAGDAEETETVSHLLRLPAEIILMVADMLPIPSAASFALCCRRLRHILGSGFWESLRSGQPDLHLEFLSSLEKDFPLHFLCQQCVCLHQMVTIKWPRVITYFPLPPCTRKPCYLHLFKSGYKINYPQIQLAMKQHYCGTDIGFPLEAFQCLEVIHDQPQQKVVLSSANAQIASNELLVRFQTWTLLPKSRRDKFIDELMDCSSYNS